MKRSVYLVVLVCGLFFFGDIVFAEIGIQVNEGGKTRLVEDRSNQPLLSEIQKKARETKELQGVGDPVVSMERSGIFYHRTVNKYKKSIFFIQELQKFAYFGKMFQYGDNELAWYVIFAMTGFFLMLFSNYRMKRYGGDDIFVTILGTLAFFSTILAVLIFFSSDIFVNLLFLALMVTFLIYSLVFDANSGSGGLKVPRFYKLLSVTIYFCALAVIVDPIAMSLEKWQMILF